jgi:hypothetical protein
VRICKELYSAKKFENEGNIDERIKRYEERSNPLSNFIQLKAVESPDYFEQFLEFYARYNEFLKERRLRPIQKSEIRKLLKDEGYNVASRHITDDGGEDIHTTCVFGLKLNDKSPQEEVVT